MRKSETCNHCKGNILDGNVIHFMLKINDGFESVFYHIDCALVLHSVICDSITKDGHLRCDVADKIRLIENNPQKENAQNDRQHQSNPKSDD